MKRSVPLVAAVNDLSGFGRCSLTVAIPVLAAMGIQAAPLPTAILSNHTAYESCFFQDLTPSLPPYLEEWRKLGLSFSAIFTGFLGSQSQVDLVERFAADFRREDTLFLADPVMGDDGALYSTYDLSLIHISSTRKKAAIPDSGMAAFASFWGNGGLITAGTEAGTPPKQWSSA